MSGIDNKIGVKSHIFSPRSATKRGLTKKYLRFLQLLQKNPLTNLFSLDNKDDTPVIETFKKDLSDNLENWSDLEMVLGQYAKNFNNENENDFIELLYNIQDSLADYLDSQDSTFTISEEDKKKAISDLLLPENYLTPREKQEFLEFKKQLSTNSTIVNVITFNYTKTFENIYLGRKTPKYWF